MVISTVWYLINKDERTALYKFSQTYKYTHKPPKIIYKHNIHHTYTRTHTHRNMQECHKCLLPAWRHLCWNFALFFVLCISSFFPFRTLAVFQTWFFRHMWNHALPISMKLSAPPKNVNLFQITFWWRRGFIQHCILKQHTKTLHTATCTTWAPLTTKAVGMCG